MRWTHQHNANARHDPSGSADTLSVLSHRDEEGPATIFHDGPGDETGEDVERMDIRLTCPRCGLRQMLQTGGAQCGGCGLRIRIAVP